MYPFKNNDRIYKLLKLWEFKVTTKVRSLPDQTKKYVKVKQSLCRPVRGQQDSRRLRLPHFGAVGT